MEVNKIHNETIASELQLLIDGVNTKKQVVEEIAAYIRWRDKQLTIHSVSDLLIFWEQFKKDNWWESDAVDVEKVLMDKFQAIYGR